MNIIIAGDGKVGSTLTRQLSAEGHDITVIDSNPSVLESSVEHYDVISVNGNAASMEVLQQAGVESADLLIAATNADEVNLLCCTTAHALNPKLHTIARIRTPGYTEQVFKLRSVFGLSMMVNPEKQAAREIQRLLNYPGFLQRDTFAKGRTEIVELQVDSGSKLCNAKLTDLRNIAKCQVLVCAVVRDGKAVAPGGDFVLRQGDRVFVTALTDNLTMLLKNLGILTRTVKRVLLCGGGRVSYYLASALCKTGMTVKIIEQDEKRCRELATLLPDAEIICGDATNQEVLESEGLGTFDAVASLTGLDELNSILSLYAHSRGVPQVITKLGHIGSENLIGGLNLGSTISPKELCCNNIVRYVRAMERQTGAALSLHTIADGKVEALEFMVDDTTENRGKELRSIGLKKDVLVVSITHGSTTEIAHGGSRFVSGDTVVVVTGQRARITELNDIFA